MTGNEDGPPAGRSVRESEIFPEPPGSGNYTSSIGAAVGIELSRPRATRALFENDCRAGTRRARTRGD